MPSLLAVEEEAMNMHVAAEADMARVEAIIDGLKHLEGPLYRSCMKFNANSGVYLMPPNL